MNAKELTEFVEKLKADMDKLVENQGASDKRIAALEGEVKKLQSAKAPASKEPSTPVKGKPAELEGQTVEQYNASNTAKPTRFYGPVPFGENGELVDPAWKVEEVNIGSEDEPNLVEHYVHRDPADPKRIIEMYRK